MIQILISPHLQAYDANAGLGGVLLHILIKRHRLQHNFLVDAAGIEQMQLPILSPNGKTNMADIKTRLVRRDSQDVAVVDAAKYLAAVPHPFLIYIIYRGSRCTFLHLGYKAAFLHIDLQQRIGVGVSAHIGEVELHRDSDAAVGYNFANQSLPCSRLNPLAEVVIAAAVTINLPILITQRAQPKEEILPALTAVTRCECQGTDILHKRRAVEALQVDGQMFLLAVNLQRLPHVWLVHEQIGVEESERLVFIDH